MSSFRAATVLASQPAAVGTPWRVLDAAPWLAVGEDGFVPDFPEHEALAVPASLWRARGDELIERAGPLAVLFDDAVDLVRIPDVSGRLAVIGAGLDAAAFGERNPTAVVLRAA